MPLKKLKYLLVFVCLFSIMEGTGISVLSLLTKSTVCQADCGLGNDDENTNERNEVKETRLPELWADENDLKIPSIYIDLKKVTYPQEQQTAHLGWVPPVPTPPPNRTV